MLLRGQPSHRCVAGLLLLYWCKSQHGLASLVFDTTITITTKINTSLSKRYLCQRIYIYFLIIYLGKIRSYFAFWKTSLAGVLDLPELWFSKDPEGDEFPYWSSVGFGGGWGVCFFSPLNIQTSTPQTSLFCLSLFALFVCFLHFSQPGQGKQGSLLLVCISFTARFVYVLAQWCNIWVERFKGKCL